MTLKTLTKPNAVLFSKLDYCPVCSRKLCKRKTIQGIPLVEFKHKGSHVMAVEATIRCLGCGRYYIVDGKTGIIDEVNFGNDQ